MENPIEDSQADGLDSVLPKETPNDFPGDKSNLNHTDCNDDFEQLKLIYEFQYSAIKEATNVLEKGISFFLLIIVALGGYIISNKESIGTELQEKLILGAIITTSFVTICVSAMAWGIYSGLRDLKKTLKLATLKVWTNTKADSFFNRGIYTSLLIGIFGTSLMIIILAFYINIYKVKENTTIPADKKQEHKQVIPKKDSVTQVLPPT